MKETLKNFYRSSYIGFILISPFAYIYQYFLHKKYLSREVFIKQQFTKMFGYEIDLINPKSLNEKINWLKLNYKHPKASIFADKFAVRQYISEMIGEDFLIPLVFTTKNPLEIIPKNLPEYPCIIKTNHDSSGGIIIRSKNKENNWKRIQNILRTNMSQNYYWDGREKQYKNIEPRIIVEKLLTDGSDNLPADYKVHCFNGKARMINVDLGRGTKNHIRNWYNTNWELEPYSWNSELGNGRFTNQNELIKVDRPKLLEEMIRLSEKLVIDFPYLRVDWYIFNGKLFFGELTLHHNGGNRPIEPFEWDQKLGLELSLPI